MSNGTKPKIINIINFIRANEIYCLETLRKQIALLKEYGLHGTYLIEYDAMIKPEFVELLKKELNQNDEIGIWLETVQPLVEKAGLIWRGRPGHPWDWHSNVGMIIGYEPKEREKIVDIVMDDFKEIFGQYPKSAGSWITDAHTLGYMANKYSISAFCNCKDQWGTDGYTLWGGYYNQAYYPSRNNAFAPAQTIENQIPVPVFRMLGNDPIYQYDEGLDTDNGYKPSSWQNVITLEPVSPMGGGNPEWIDWYFKENFSDRCLSFGYAQVGQENSFGWEAIKKGLEYQVKTVAEKVKNGEIEVRTLGETGSWFRKKYKLTPISSISALSDWRNMGYKSVWYYSRFYRVNFLQKDDRFWIRDIYLFDEKYNERYLSKKCATNACIYDNLPVIDGNLWSGGSIRAGIYPVEIISDGTVTEVTGSTVKIRTDGENEMLIEWYPPKGGCLKIYCRQESLSICYEPADASLNWGMILMTGEHILLPIERIDHDTISFKHNDYKYKAHLEAGQIIKINERNQFMLTPSGNKIILKLTDD